MKIIRTYKLFALLILFLTGLLSSCVKIGEYYLGLNLQPNMDDSPPLNGLNVYGILKTGTNLDTINHFFEVQRMIALNNMVEEEVDSAIIQLTRTTNEGELYYYRPKYYSDGLYFDEEIETAPGDRWDFSCTLDTFDVYSSCVIPNIPVVVGGVEVLDGSFRFTVKADETAFMYTIYIINGEQFHLEKKIHTANKNTVFNIKPEWEVSSGQKLIYIFAYDKNIREYNTTTNTLFKPNAFRPSFSTVDGGYGTFGAVSSCLKVLN